MREAGARVLNGSLTEPKLLWHFNRKRGKEELLVGWGEATSCQGIIVQSFLCSFIAALPSENSFEGSGARFTLLPFPQPAHQAGHP